MHCLGLKQEVGKLKFILFLPVMHWNKLNKPSSQINPSPYIKSPSNTLKKSLVGGGGGSLIEDLKYFHCTLTSSRYYSCDPGGRDGHSLKCKPHSYMFMHMYASAEAYDL